MNQKSNGIKLKPVNDRKKPCYFCGTHASVKYDLYDEDAMKTVPCCNVCVLKRYVFKDKYSKELSCIEQDKDKC